jgi:hypothetical protein
MDPIVNLQDPVGKIVGRRRPAGVLQCHPGQKEGARAWAAVFPFPKVRPGVYRFKTHEEADAWWTSQMTQPKK